MSYKILYIEDDLTLGLLVKESLEKHGYEVLKALNGADGPLHFKAFKPHLCLLDVMLPGADGYAVATHVRAVDAHVPIIFLTARIQAEDLVKGFKAGCNDYVRKPFNMEELLLRIANWLEVKHGGQKTGDMGSINIGTYYFDAQKQVLACGGTVTRLSHKETALLTVLCNYRNTIVSRDYILQKVWGNDTIYNSRTLDVYINRLRKYLRSDSHIELITLKGIGYRFIC